MTTSDPEEQALLAAIHADPDDEDLRLVYADWLEERGDERAEFIRTYDDDRVWDRVRPASEVD